MRLVEAHSEQERLRGGELVLEQPDGFGSRLGVWEVASRLVGRHHRANQVRVQRAVVGQRGGGVGVVAHLGVLVLMRGRVVRRRGLAVGHVVHVAGSLH